MLYLCQRCKHLVQLYAQCIVVTWHWSISQSSYFTYLSVGGIYMAVWFLLTGIIFNCFFKSQIAQDSNTRYSLIQMTEIQFNHKLKSVVVFEDKRDGSLNKGATPLNVAVVLCLYSWVSHFNQNCFLFIKL